MLGLIVDLLMADRHGDETQAFDEFTRQTPMSSYEILIFCFIGIIAAFAIILTI